MLIQELESEPRLPALTLPFLARSTQFTKRSRQREPGPRLTPSPSCSLLLSLTLHPLSAVLTSRIFPPADVYYELCYPLSPTALCSHPSPFIAPYRRRRRCLSILHAPEGCCCTIQADLRRTVTANQAHRVPTTITISPPAPPLTCSKTRTALTAALCILPTLTAMSASFDNGSLAARAFVTADAAPPLVKIAALLATGYPPCPHLSSDPKVLVSDTSLAAFSRNEHEFGPRQIHIHGGRYRRQERCADARHYPLTITSFVRSQQCWPSSLLAQRHSRRIPSSFVAPGTTN